jgi:hypothetical protein
MRTRSSCEIAETTWRTTVETREASAQRAREGFGNVAAYKGLRSTSRTPAASARSVNRAPL